MGFLKSLIGVAAPIVGNALLPGIGGALGGLVGGAVAGSGGAKQSGSQTVTTQNQLDPRAQAILYGDGTEGNKGLLSQYQQMLNQPQGTGTSMLGAAAQNWLSQASPDVLNKIYSGATGLMTPGQAPQALAAQTQAAQSQAQNQINPAGMGDVLWNTGESFKAPSAFNAAQVGSPQQVSGATVSTPNGPAASMAGAAQINAPSQNNLDLSGAYQNFISGASGNNPMLNKSLQSGIDLSNAGFNKNVNTLTGRLQRSVLPGIRSNSILSGQYGGSRQGIAQGLALSDYTSQLNDANSILGAQNSANVTGQLANAYNQGQDRALAATQGLGAQQYGVAQQNASMQQQANLANQAAANAAASQGYQGSLSGALANAGYSQQANLANQAANQAAASQNAQLQQQAGLNNYAGDLQAAQQSAANRQQANLANQQVGNNASQFNAAQTQAANLFNASQGQQNNQFNAGQLQNANQLNAQMQQQANMANLQAQLGTNSLNQQGQQAGLGALSGLLSSVAGYGQNADNYQLNRAQQVNSLLAPYLSMGGSSTQSQPLYQNQGANALGGAATGLGLFNSIKNSGIFGGGNSNSFASNNASVLAQNPSLSLNDLMGAF